MDLGLEGKLALITGSTAGIGLATATELAAEGAGVIVNGRTNERVERAVRAIRERVPAADVRGIAADLGTAAGCRWSQRALRSSTFSSTTSASSNRNRSRASATRSGCDFSR